MNDKEGDAEEDTEPERETVSSSGCGNHQGATGSGNGCILEKYMGPTPTPIPNLADRGNKVTKLDDGRCSGNRKTFFGGSGNCDDAKLMAAASGAVGPSTRDYLHHGTRPPN